MPDSQTNAVLFGGSRLTLFLAILCLAATWLAFAVGAAEGPGGLLVGGLLLIGDVALGLTLPLFTLLDWKRLSSTERALGVIVSVLCLVSAVVLNTSSGG